MNIISVFLRTYLSLGSIMLKPWLGTSPRLTTVAQNFHLLGMECSKLIIDQIENGGSNTTIKVKIPTQLMLGETVRKI